MLRRLRLLRKADLTLANFLDELVRASGDCLVSLELDRSGDVVEETRLSDLHREVAEMSGFLVERAGLKHGDRVAIWKTNDARAFRWFLAVIRAGGVAVPLNPLLSLVEARRILSGCGASTLVTDAEFFASSIRSRDALPVSCWVQREVEPPLEGFLPFSPGGVQPPPAPVHAKDVAAIFFSSGTEGSPKGAELTSEALLSGRRMALFSLPLIGRRRMALLALPWAHIMAVSTAVYGLLAGVPACLMPRFELPAAVEAIRRHRVTLLVGVPSMFVRLVNSSPPPEALASVRLWVSASDRLPAPHRRRLLEYGSFFGRPGGLFHVGPVFVNAYGMVELGGVAMIGAAGPFLPGDGEYCIPLPPFRIRVADETGRRAPPNTPAECQVSGPGVTGRYWGQGEASPGTLTPDGWFRTGDLAIRDRLGLIRLTGRAKDVIKCGGYSVFAQEVEDALGSHPAVARATVIGLPHPEKGEVPVGIVECRPGVTAGEADLLAWCRSRLAAYKAPRRIFLAETGSLPQGVTEKILKRVLKERYGGGNALT